MQLKRIGYNFSICQVEDFSQIDLCDEYCFIGKKDKKKSVVCITERCPDNILKRDDGWRAFMIQGVLDFSLVGILSKIAQLLSCNGISIFAISTYNTDYILVKQENYDESLQILLNSGYSII